MYVLPYSGYSYGTVRKNSSFMFCMASQSALQLRLICIVFHIPAFFAQHGYRGYKWASTRDGCWRGPCSKEACK